MRALPGAESPAAAGDERRRSSTLEWSLAVACGTAAALVLLGVWWPPLGSQCAGSYEHGRGDNCLGGRCCDPNRTCFRKHEYFGACRKSCTKGVDDSQPAEAQTPWSCERVAGEVARPATHSTPPSRRRDPDGFRNGAYVELRSDPMAGGFLQRGEDGAWDVWPRPGGRSFQGFLGYGYNRVRARGGRVAAGIDPGEWELVAFPLAPPGPAPGGGSFFTGDYRHLHHGDYEGMVGKALRFTISGLGSSDCGCNANFYAVRKGGGCDGSGMNGGLCEEIDFFEGNKYSWHSTLHALTDGGQTDHDGLTTGYGGTTPTKPNFPSFDGEEYGPRGSMIDTEKPFSVAVSFPRGRGGRLKGMSIELSQQGKPSMQHPLSMHLYEYKGSFHAEPGAGGGTNVEHGMVKIEKRMNEGVTVMSSLWSGGMRWLDGAASEHGANNVMDGKCTHSGSCSGFSVSHIVVEDLQDRHPVKAA